MIEFQQWLGFLLVVIIGLAGFWIFIFLLGILPYWIAGHFKDLRKQKKAEKNENTVTEV